MSLNSKRHRHDDEPVADNGTVTANLLSALAPMGLA